MDGTLVAGRPEDVADWTSEEWEAALEQSHTIAARCHWGRFMSVFGDEADLAFQGPSGLSDAALLDRLADAEALVTQLMVEQSSLLRVLRERRLRDQAVDTPDHDPQSCTRGCCDADGWVTLEVAQALAVTERQVHRRLDTAERLTRYRAVAEAMRDGLLQSWTATKLLEHLDLLAPYVCADRLDVIEQTTLAWLLDRPRTVGQLNARMRRLLLSLRPEDGDESDPLASGRRVDVVPAEMGDLATVVAQVPEVDAVAIAGTLRALAAEPVNPADLRTRDQREADLLTSCLTGVRAAHGFDDDLELIARSPGSLSVRLDVTIPASSLRGHGAPAHIPGYGVVPAAAGAALAGAADCDVTTRPLVYDPGTGRLLGSGAGLDCGQRPAGAGSGEGGSRMSWLHDVLPASGYQHPPVMERLVHLRDATCRAPGCARRAQRCDCDHVVPYPDGPTSVDNTCCLCRRHHRLKTHAPGWSLSMARDGTATWTTPTGRTLRTDPADYRDGGDHLTAAPDGDIPPF